MRVQCDVLPGCVRIAAHLETALAANLDSHEIAAPENLVRVLNVLAPRPWIHLHAQDAAAKVGELLKL